MYTFDISLAAWEIWKKVCPNVKVNTVPADAPTGARTSAGTVMTKIRSKIHAWLTTEVQSIYNYETVYSVAIIQDFTHQVSFVWKSWKACINTGMKNCTCEYMYRSMIHCHRLKIEWLLGCVTSSSRDWREKKNSSLSMNEYEWQKLNFTVIIKIKLLVLILRLTVIIIMRSYITKDFFTPLVVKAEYSWVIRSIPRLLIPLLLTSPGHQ